MKEIESNLNNKLIQTLAEIKKANDKALDLIAQIEVHNRLTAILNCTETNN